jgi:hypothetical protein
MSLTYFLIGSLGDFLLLTLQVLYIFKHEVFIENMVCNRAQWHKPVIPAVQEAEIRRIVGRALDSR